MTRFTLPFGIREKEHRIDENDSSHKYKFKTKHNVEEISKQIERIKNEREKHRKEKEMQSNMKYEANRKALKKIQSKMIKQRQEEIKKGKNSSLLGNPTYTGIQNKKLGINEEKNQKLTWKVLEELSYSDINQDTSDDFKPSDVLLDESDDELEEELTRLGVSR